MTDGTQPGIPPVRPNGAARAAGWDSRRQILVFVAVSLLFVLIGVMIGQIQASRMSLVAVPSASPAVIASPTVSP